MKKTILFLITLFLLSYSAKSQSIWKKEYDSGFSDEASHISKCYDGGYIISGSKETCCRGWIVKTDSFGVQQWSKTVNSPEIYTYNIYNTFLYDNFSTQLLDFSIMNFVYGYENAISSTTTGSVFKYNTNGSLLWRKTYDIHFPRDIISTSDSGVVLLGHTPNIHPSYPSWELHNGSPKIIKLNSNGDSLWSKTYPFHLLKFNGDSLALIATSIKQTNDNGFVIFAAQQKNPSNNVGNYFLIKTDSIGDTLWTKSYFQNPNQYLVTTEVIQTSDSGYLMIGSNGSDRTWLVKTNNIGDILWTKMIGPNMPTPFYTFFEKFESVKELPSGDYIILGKSYMSAIWVMGLTKLDNSGNTLWENQLNQILNGQPSKSIYLTNSNGYIFGGTIGYSSSKNYFLIRSDSIGNYYNKPPDAIINSVTGTYNTGLTINYNLIDSTSDDCYIIVDYSLDNGNTWSNIPYDSGGSGLTSLSSSPLSGITHQFIWLPEEFNLGIGSCPNNGKNVLFKITPYDFSEGQSDNTPIYLANNLIDSVACYWNQLNSGVGDYLKDVFFLNNDTGFVSGVGGTLIKTTNQGNTWSVINMGTPEWLNSLFFTNNMNGIIVGANGYISKTTNGGTTWSTINSGTSDWLFSVFFPSSQIGYAVGGSASGNGQTILKTIDGGLTWSNQDTANSSQLRSVYFLNDNIGYASGYNGSVIKTIDGGINWIPLNTNLPLYYTLNSVHFTSIDTGYAGGGWQIGSNNTQAIIKTVDGGVTWSDISSLNDDFINDIISVGPNRLIAAGYNGTLLKSTDEGINWEIRNSTNNLDLHSTFFVDENLGFSVGSTGKIVITNPSIVGLNEIDNKDTYFILFPNPTSQQLSIETVLKLTEIKIIDLTGKLIKTIKQNTNTVNVADLTAGIYFIKLITDEMTITKKFVKQ